MGPGSDKQKIIIDASCCKKGGGAQVAANLVKYLLNNFDDLSGYKFLVSPEVQRHLNSFSEDWFNRVMFRVCSNPTNPVSWFVYTKIIRDFVPDLEDYRILTVFGPNYYLFRKVTLQGIADPYLVNWNLPIKKRLTIIEYIKISILVRIKELFLFQNRKSKFYWCETELYKTKICERFSIPDQNIVVIPNEASSSFKASSFEPNIFGSEMKILFVGANYPHKNFKLIPDLITMITNSKRLKTRNFEFLITLEKEENLDLYEYFRSQKVDSKIQWIGKLSQSDLAKRMSECIILQPSLMEVYSATYIEAIYLNRPLIVADLDFARSICNGGALYFDPLNASNDIEKLLYDLVENPSTEIGLSYNREKIFQEKLKTINRSEILIKRILAC